jgi:hypothetical protein
MICYLDKTFCGGDGCAKFQACPDALTKSVINSAATVGLEISAHENPRELDCYEPKNKEAK